MAQDVTPLPALERAVRLEDDPQSAVASVTNDVERGNTLEVAHVACHQPSILHARRGCYQQIHCGDGFTTAAQLAEWAAVLEREPLVSGDDPKCSAESVDSSVFLGASLR